MKSAKPFTISKQQVWESWLKVKRNKGGFGVDQQSIEEFEGNLKDNLYKIWNRLSSGSYYPPAVKGVPIPKKSGGIRMLGVPTVADRVAQMVIKDRLEPLIEPHFHQDSYGYRPNRSALDAIAVTRKRCWHMAWVLEFDIKGLFDNIDHELLLKAVTHHCKEKWVIIYVKRWLKAPMLDRSGQIIERNSGTPQGGVISPLLANLFMHYAFDQWMKNNFKTLPFCRYADDGLVHCHSQKQAEFVLSKLEERMREIRLELHPDKTKIIYCRDEHRNENHEHCSFEFLGYMFRPRMVRSKDGKMFLGFTPGASPASLRSMGQTMRQWKLHFRVSCTIEDIANQINPVIRGWANYYGSFNKSALEPIWIKLNWRLAKWMSKKYKNLRCHKTKSILKLGTIAKNYPNLFVHWTLNCRPTAG